MRKGRWALVLILAFGLSLCGCLGASENGRQEQKEEEQENTEAREEEQESTEAREEAEPQELEEHSLPPQAAPQAAFVSGDRDWYSDEKSKWIVHTEYQTVEISGEGYETAAEKIGQWSEARKESLLEDAKAMLGEAERYTETSERDFQDTYAFSSVISYSLERADSQLLSLVEYHYEYRGGAHGNYGYGGHTFDAQTGERLELSAFISDMDGFQKAAQKDLIEKLKETYSEGLMEDYEEIVGEIWEREGGPQWYLNGSGFVFVFNPYEVGSYAMGEARVTLPYPDYEAYLSEAYDLTGTDAGPMAASLSAGVPTETASDGEDGESGRLCVFLDEQGEYGEGFLSVEYGGKKVRAEEFPMARLVDLYLLRLLDGREFVLFSADYASDDMVTFFYELTEEGPKERERIEGLSVGTGVVNTDSLSMKMHMDVFGSYQSSMDYAVGEDGGLEPQSAFFQVDLKNYPSSILTVSRDIPVWTEGSEGILPAGSQIRITASDLNGTAVYENMDTQETGEIHYTMGTGDYAWTHYIDGVSEFDCFEMLPYAG